MGEITLPKVTEQTLSNKPPSEQEADYAGLILNEAAEILEDEGWCRGAFNSFGNRCAIGGIGAAVNRLVFPYGKKAKARREAERRLAALLSTNDAYPDDKSRVIYWNDRVAESVSEVVDKMREAATRR